MKVRSKKTVPHKVYYFFIRLFTMVILEDLAELAEVKYTHDCYLTHPNRSEDTDDTLLDAINLLNLTKFEFKLWVLSKQSWLFLEKGYLELSDFMEEVVI